MQVIVDSRKYDTDKMEQLIDEQPNQRHSNGVTLEGVWVTKRSKKVLVVTYSVWGRGNSGECVGRTAHFADEREIARLADRYGSRLDEYVPEGEY